MNHQEHEEHKGHEEGKVLRLATEALAREVVDAGLKVHKALGPGLLESTYEHCLAHELKLRGIPCQRQVAIPLNYEGMRLDTGYRIDMVADGIRS